MKSLATTAFLLTTILHFNLSLAQDEERKVSGIKPASSSMEPQQIKSYADLVSEYKKMNINVDSNDENQILMFRTKRTNFAGVMVVKWDQINGVCHFIQTMPYEIKKEDYSLFLEAAAKLNHGFLFPGIGLDMKRGGSYYRLSVPIEPRKYLLDFEVSSYTNFTLNKASEFLPTLKKVINREATVDDVIKVHQLHMIEWRAERNAMGKLAGKYESDAMEHDWTILFSNDGKINLTRDGKPVVESTYQVKGNQLTIQDVIDDQLDGKPLVTKPGIFKFELNGEQLTFSVVKDNSENRVNVMTSKPWKRITE